MFRLHKWNISFSNTQNPYMAPELRKASIAGNVEGHSKFQDGDYIRPNRIVAANPALLVFKTRSGSIYQLCKVDPSYLKQHPDALARVREYLATFDELNPYDF